LTLNNSLSEPLGALLSAMRQRVAGLDEIERHRLSAPWHS
jgi:hypothetical protein